MELMDLFARWVSIYGRADRTVGDYRFFLRALARAQGITRLEHVTPERVADWVQSRIVDDGVKGQTVNRCLAAILAPVKIAVTLGLVPRERLRALRDLRVRVPVPKRLRARHLTPDSFLRLMLHAGELEPRVILPAEVAAFAGLRSGELARIHADDVRLEGEGGWLDVYPRPEFGNAGRVKTNSVRNVPLCAELRALLAVAIPIARERHAGWIFPAREPGPARRGRRPIHPFVSTKTLGNQLRRATRGTEWEGTTWPVLRHTRASWWAQEDVALHRIAFFLGNSVEIVERFYAAMKPGYDPECERRPAA